jgi:hypothetical protein
MSQAAAERASDKQWERMESVRQEEWKVDASRRWDAQRLSAYADVTATTLTMTRVLGDLAPYWERQDDPPPGLLEQFEDQREAVTHAHTLAVMLASRPVRVALRQLWSHTLKLGAALDLPPDGSETGDEMARRHSQEIGVWIGKFRLAVATELGVDDATDPVSGLDLPGFWIGPHEAG